jgi:crotonobetainyl-CoA:carnitine CoA-transferase CaiB-like acyl-CoA transferase
LDATHTPDTPDFADGSTPHAQPAPPPPRVPQVLRGVRVLSLALNLPGPAALMRLAAMGAHCVKVDPPGGDPMALYSPAFHALMHRGIEVCQIDLKQAEGRAALQRRLADTDVLLTSSRPSALARLGLDSVRLAEAHPQLAWVAIVGEHAPLDEVPGHDLTYQAEAGLVDGQLPPTLAADMGGSLLAVEAVLQAVLAQRQPADADAAPPAGLHLNVALAEAARYAALPHAHGLTAPGGLLGGLHPGYQVLPCQDGWVALAALEPHFLAGWQRCIGSEFDPRGAFSGLPALVEAGRAWCAARPAAQLNQLARELDLPLLAWPQR